MYTYYTVWANGKKSIFYGAHWGRVRYKIYSVCIRVDFKTTATYIMSNVGMKNNFQY